MIVVNLSALVDSGLCLPQVAIMAPDMASFHTVEEAAAYSQEQEEIHPVTLLATSNGTHIAVQVCSDKSDLIWEKQTSNSLFWG